MTAKVTITITSDFPIPESFLRNAPDPLLEITIMSAMLKEIGGNFMRVNNKPYLGTLSQVNVKVVKREAS
jgi:hypothetical protein